ncbi:MAG: HAD-IA family hydrolase [Planctomycetota bacterium JB042]
MIVLFDLDGTLIDSIELIRRSYEHTWETHVGRPLDEAEWLAGLGRPLRYQFLQVTRDEDAIAAMTRTYRAHNLEHHDRLVRPFDGVPAMLGALAAAGARLGIVTSKIAAAARRGLARCDLDADRFEVLIGADDVERHKPEPEPVLAACARLGVAPEEAVYVGDSPHDIAAGRAAGSRTAGVLWGPFSRPTLEAAAPDVLVEAPAKLCDWLLSESAAR